MLKSGWIRKLVKWIIGIAAVAALVIYVVVEMVTG